MMDRRTLLRAVIAAPVAVVVPLLSPKSEAMVVLLEADSLTAEALLYFKHVNGRVGRFGDRMANRDKEYAATGMKPIGWQRSAKLDYASRIWRNEETGAIVSQEMLDDLRCSMQSDVEKRNGYTWCTPYMAFFSGAFYRTR